MKVLTEMELRAKWKTPEDGVYHVEAGTFVTPMAKDFLREKGVSMVIDPEEKKSIFFHKNLRSHAGSQEILSYIL